MRTRASRQAVRCRPAIALTAATPRSSKLELCAERAKQPEQQPCRLKYFTVWDPDHRIEVAPGQFQALFADLFDKAVKTTAYAISDYRTTPDLAARLMEASGQAPPTARFARGLLGRILRRK